jgi:hypothetical protein
MLDKKTLLELSKINGLKPWQQEKHYIQALILTIVSEQPVVFKGGTYLWFFHGLRRFSEDLDFTASEKLSKNLSETVSKGLELFGAENQSKIITDNETTLSFRISAKGPLNTGQKDLCRVYVEISQREKILEKTLPLRLDMPAYQLPIKNLAGMSLQEASAEKVRAIITREKARDIYDLQYLIQNKKAKFGKKLIEEKLSYYSKSFSEKEFLKKINSKKEYYSKELRNLVFEELPAFKKAQKTIKDWIPKEKEARLIEQKASL